MHTFRVACRLFLCSRIHKGAGVPVGDGVNMKKAVALPTGLVMVVLVLMAFQTTQQPALFTRIAGIQSSWAGECSAGVVDNTSALSRKNVAHLVTASGTGTWSVAITFSNSTCTGSYSAYLSTATITQARHPHRM